MEVSSTLEQPNGSRIRRRDNLDDGAVAAVGNWSSRGFAERAIVDFIRRCTASAAGRLATSSRNSVSASTNSSPRQSNCSDLPGPRASARRPRSKSARCAGGVCRSARTQRHSFVSRPPARMVSRHTSAKGISEQSLGTLSVRGCASTSDLDGARSEFAVRRLRRPS
jgi:hypothetical protein